MNLNIKKSIIYINKALHTYKNYITYIYMNRHPNDYKEKHIHLSKKHKGYENELEKTVIEKVE